MNSQVRTWIRNIVATVINGAASGVVLIIADPKDFNLAEPQKLLMTSAVFALFGLANFLKQHPLPEESVEVKTTITHTGGNPPLPAVLLLAGALAFAPACSTGGIHSAPITANPTATQVEQTRKDVIRAIEATTSALKIANIAVASADAINKANPAIISNDVLRTIATAGKAFADGADIGIRELEAGGSNASMVATAKRLTQLLDPFLLSLEQSKNEKLSAFAASLRIGMTVVRTIGG
ncbi:MAG TPA: hypothetical protein PLX85_09300 [Dehalococcoidia bacterium]|mgnify:CR=1 FL=1|nr:hypothetical protein [Dehalococcoidia bacterium]